MSPQSRKKAISRKATSKKASSKKTSAKRTSSKKGVAAGRRVPPAAKAIPAIPEAPREAPQPGTEKQKTRVRRKT